MVPKLCFLFILLFGVQIICSAQSLNSTSDVAGKIVPYTTIKDQSRTGTCWSFSTTSLMESETIRKGIGDVDLSEMFTVRNVYIEKAKNYILRQGKAQFGPGGLGHDVIQSISTYGVVPESVYSGLMLGQKAHDHDKLDNQLKSYLDKLLETRPLPNDWMETYTSILDEHLGKPPLQFTYRERVYTPLSFASEYLHFKASDYVNITSFTHHPYYTSFNLEAPDNFSNGLYYNIPLNEMMQLIDQSIQAGFSIMWDADVSNDYFQQGRGYAIQSQQTKSTEIKPTDDEMEYDQKVRQQLFENLTLQDDHLMHIVGIEEKGGKKFYVVKNSWGQKGPFKGLIYVSEAYMALNTISLVLPKDALNPILKAKLRLQ